MELSVRAKVLLDSCCGSGDDSDGAVTAATARATDGYILLSCRRRGAVRTLAF